MPDCRPGIVKSFSEWTALSALRSGAPIKSRKDVYGVLRAIKFEPLFAAAGPISSADFDAWHEHAVAEMLFDGKPLNVGWAAKIINVYLKTRVYLAGEGRSGLASAIHPPIDGGLWEGLREQFGESDPHIVADSNCVTKIKDIKSYACYQRVIAGCRQAAAKLGCDLIEVEQLWRGTRVLNETI